MKCVWSYQPAASRPRQETLLPESPIENLGVGSILLMYGEMEGRVVLVVAFDSTSE
jgi:hypothetical protein